KARDFVNYIDKIFYKYTLILMAKFIEDQIYHVFNQGNNRKPIFFDDENYLFFLKKIRKHLLPYTNILCYCLMPNHFHMLIMPNDQASKLSNAIIPVKQN